MLVSPAAQPQKALAALRFCSLPLRAAMNTPYPQDDGPAPAGHWPASVASEWCSLHVLIEQLSQVQRRLGTPLEEPADLRRVREYGETIRQKLEHLEPWMEESSVR